MLNRRFPIFLVLGTVLLLAVAGLSGCAHSIPIKGTLHHPAATAKIPATFGVYYSPEFRNLKHSGSWGGEVWTFPLGLASVKLFDQLFPLAFTSTIPVAGLPPASGSVPDAVAVIEPAVEAFDFTLPQRKTGSYTVEITYRFTLYSPNGDPVASWTVTGYGAKPGEAGVESERRLSEAANLALEDAANKFLTSFSDVPEVQQWLKRKKLESSVPAPGLHAEIP